MFALEFLQKLKEYNLSKEEEKKTILKTLYVLAKENKSEFENLVQKESENVQLQSLIKDLAEYESQVNSTSKVNDSEDDIIKLKKAFDVWEIEFKKTQEANSQCIEIITDIINFYYTNKPHVLTTIIEIEQGEMYEKFKLHLQNSLRAKIAEDIENYFDSSKYNDLNFFDKIKKKKKIKKMLNKVINYEFDFKEIKEVLQ
jgi:hypothetical protein